MNIDKIDLFNEKSEVLKALAHPIRLCIVQGLIEEEGRNVTTMQNCLNAPQSTVSQHLSKLKAAGIIEGRRKGTEINYYVVNEDAKKIISSILD
ncbi:helix-turn-helix transcriptional regulator [Clostridium sp. D2Q-11]|uniref:Helix-turn-helix transcriptional regulator n=1 Tax=Anaeromonas frigoriresistens TaxID=2683708 RepID=A0A942V1G0_9FIRM|nr:metalloregulator ArsR/SmtB family transcription factor [Anaeromonas frigoriresistens]MBS4538262.1 helix-turn-helix transcriptional regulator [Anaeromonas frigoriresistens]